MRKGYMLVVAGAVLALLALLAVRFANAPRNVVIDVTLSDYAIAASQSMVYHGDLVTLRITNAGKEMHELEVEGYDLEVEDIAPGETRTLQFEATMAGTFELVCHFEDHAAKGMKLHFGVITR